MIKSITVEILSGKNKIMGLFRALLTIGNREILVIGNKKNSLFFTLFDIEIKRILVRHTDQLISRQILGQRFEIPAENIDTAINLVKTERVLTEEYTITEKQQAYSLLVFLYTKYLETNGKSTCPSIDTDCYDIKTPYSVMDSDEEYMSKKFEQPPILGCVPNTSCRALSPLYNNNNNKSYIPAVSGFYKKADPALIASDDMKTFLNRVLEGHRYERGHRKQEYSGQLSGLA